MADEQDRAEALDEDELGEFPPEKPLGAQAYGAAGAEPHAPESVVARAAREEPEEVPDAVDPDDVRDVEVLSEEDIAGGDSTIRDVATEKSAAVPAEEAAMHVVDEGLADFDSEVDDPQLEAAYEIDPEVLPEDR
jgi:hypothetical protein